MDSQTVKTTEAGGERGYDGGKKINGRKRHVVTDTIGTMQAAVVTAADVEDRDGGVMLCLVAPELAEALEKLWTDQKYKGEFVTWMREDYDINVEVVKRREDQKGFVVLPRRWVVERTLGWLMRYRRLSKDYERYSEYSESMIYLASIHIMLKKLCPPQLDRQPYEKKKAS
jgi:putative transposase